MLGVVLEEHRRIQEAIACYRKAIALAPDLAEAHVALGRLLEQDRHKKL
ncbi:MAG: tetratricopeptide repeat protein [Proteobacteria bacterium]|nr:MAG: tetratricopeptide repeat protein [Pseudomonadota bacterium]